MFPEGGDHSSDLVLWRALGYPYSVDDVGKPVDRIVTTCFKYFCCNVEDTKSSVGVELFEGQGRYCKSGRRSYLRLLMLEQGLCQIGQDVVETLPPTVQTVLFCIQLVAIFVFHGPDILR